MGNHDLVDGMVLQERLPYKGYRYHRVVRLYEKDDLVFMQEVKPSVRPADSAVAHPAKLSSVRRRLGKDFQEVRECIRPASMQTTLTVEQRIQCEDKMGPLYSLLWDEETDTVNEETLRRLLSKKTRGPIIKQHAVECGVTESALYRALTRFCWFGCSLTAFLPLDEFKGPRGRLFTTGKAGPLPAGAALAESLRAGGYDVRLTGLSRKERDAGRPCPSHYENRILEALKTHFVKNRLSLKAVYELFVRQHFNAGVREPHEGATRQYKWHSILTFRQFEYRAKYLIEKHKLRSLREGELESVQKNRSRHGKARSIAISACDIYDMDGTDFDFELSSSYEHFRPCGRPTVLIAVDRYSGVIVGFFDWCGAEKWDAYLMLAFSAFTPKDTLLEELGLPACSWRAYGVPRGVFLDRGPACMSKAGKQAFCKQTGVARIIAPPRRGDLKPHVESVFDKLRSAISWIPGGYAKVRTRKDADQWKFARANAYLTPSAFRELLVRAIIDYNSTRFTPQNKTREMRDVSIPTTPEEIFDFSKAENRGDASIEWSPEVIFGRLLAGREASVRWDGVHLDNRRYVSKELEELYNTWTESVCDRRVKPKIAVAPVPFLSSRLAWLRSPDDIVYLKESDEDSIGLRSVSHEEDGALHVRDLAEERVMERERPSKSLIRAAQQDIIDDTIELNVSSPNKRKVSKQAVSQEKRKVLKEQTSVLAQQVASTLKIPGIEPTVSNAPTVSLGEVAPPNSAGEPPSSHETTTNDAGSQVDKDLRRTTRGPSISELYALRNIRGNTTRH